MRAEVYRSDNDDWYFRIVADNNEVVAQSEGYENKADAVAIVSKISEERFPVRVKV